MCTGSFNSDHGDYGGARAAYDSLSCLLDSVPPPSNTPDSMVGDLAASTNKSSTVDKDAKIMTGMGSKFKLQLQEIEARKQDEGKHKKLQSHQEQDVLKHSKPPSSAPTLGSNIAPAKPEPVNSNNITTIHSDILTTNTDHITLENISNQSNSIHSTVEPCTDTKTSLKVLDHSVPESVHALEVSAPTTEVKKSVAEPVALFCPQPEKNPKDEIIFLKGVDSFFY